MSDYKPHVVIDDQKNIILPEELKNHMVQFDHNVKTITFDCPRYSDGRDLSTMRIYVNYFRKSGEKDSDVCQNIKVDSKDTNLIHFEWVPKRSATLEAGVLAFLICAEKEDAEGNQENAWHTKLCKDLKIAEGIDCLKAVIEKYPTIITYLLTRMEDVESIATPEAMQTYVNQYLLENPPSGMTDEERALLEENIALTRQIQTDLATVDQSKADAIICTAEGSTIVATDSAEAGFEGLHLYGRSEQVTTTGAQLLNPELFENEKYQNCNSVEDYFNIVQNADYWITGFVPVEPNKTYTTSFVPSKGAFYDESKIVIKTATVGISASLTTPDNAAYVVLNVEAGSVPFGASVMMNEGETALPWEPYTGGKPSPSADYPQEIVSAGDDGSIEVGSIAPSCIVTSNSDAGYIVHDGTIGNAGGSVERVSGYVECTGGNTLYISIRYPQLPNSDIWVGVGFYDVSKNFISRIARNITEKSSVCDVSMSIPTDARYMMISFRSYGNGILAAYDTETSKQTLTALTPNGLPGIKVTDASLATYTDENGQMWCADEIDFERGVYVQRIIRTILPPDLVWKKSSEVRVDRYFTGSYQMFGGNKINPTTKPIVTHFDRSLDGAILNGVEISRDGGVGFSFAEAGTSTVDDFVEFLTNNTVTAMAILATPIETPLSDEELAAYKALHTNKPTTTIMNSENVHMKVDYVADTENHIKQNYVPLSEYTALEERVAAIEELVIS